MFNEDHSECLSSVNVSTMLHSSLLRCTAHRPSAEKLRSGRCPGDAWHRGCRMRLLSVHQDWKHVAEALLYWTCPTCPPSCYAKQSQSHGIVFPKDKTRDLGGKVIKKWQQMSLAAFLYVRPLYFLEKQEKQPCIQKKPKQHDLI